jgi:ATP-binding cassette subfamily B protein
MKNLWKALCMVHRCAPRSFWLRVVYVVLQSVLPLVNLYILKGLIDSVTAGIGIGGYGLQVMWLLVTMCFVFLLNRIVSALNGINNDVLSQRLIDYVSDQLQRQSARLDLQYYDNPAYHDTFHRAQQEASFRPLQILNNIMSFLGAVISIAGVVAMLATASWWFIVVMIVAVIPGFAVRLYKARRIYRFRRENTQLYRRTSYYGAILTSRDAAKELRTYRLSDLFRSRFVDARKRLVDRLLSISRRLGALDVLCAVVEAAAMFAVVWLLVNRAWSGAITIGSFVMLFEAFRRGQGYLSSLVGAISGLYDNRLFIGNLFEFLELQPTILPPAEPLPVPDDIHEVEFRDITFRYPDMDRDVLSHFSLRARKGGIVRIDGRNGFGKSTLIKLLLRLYDPQQGQVLVDGIDIRRFDPAELRSRMGVLFQDFLRFSLTVEENIALGDVQGRPDIPGALGLSGADEFVSRLPQGERTLLGRLFDGGSELSMGQWQRIALARALASDAPILLLDEPTAWLDADARRHLQQTLQQLQPGRIIILVTHSQTFDL